MFDLEAEVKKILKQLPELEQKMVQLLPHSEAGIETLKIYNRLNKVQNLWQEINLTQKKLTEAKAALASGDVDLAHLAQEERNEAEKKLAQLEATVKNLLRPADPLNSANTIIEIRAGTGGEEAALFARDLFRMYSRYAERVGFKTESLSQSLAEAGGIKEVIFKVAGEDVFRSLRHEGGVHRVQRVPHTESSGRIHTSTATVAIMPEPMESEFSLDPKEVKIETSTSGGAGGQSVNTTYSAIRMIHLPTGITVSCQDERSQQQNRAKAWAVMTARVYARKREEALAKETAERRTQVGSGERAEKIRTYNYPQDRVTDHRLEQSWHNLPEIMDGNLDPIISTLIDYQENKNEPA